MSEPLKYQLDPRPMDTSVDDRFDIREHDISLQEVNWAINRLFSDYEIFCTETYLNEDGTTTTYFVDYVFNKQGPIQYLINILKQRGLFYSLDDKDLQESLNLEEFDDLSGENWFNIAKALPNNYVTEGFYVYDLWAPVKITNKYSGYIDFLILSLPFKQRLGFFLTYQLNQFPDGDFFQPKMSVKDEGEIDEVKDHAFFLETLHTRLLRMKDRFIQSGDEEIYEYAKKWVEQKQSVTKRSPMGERILDGELLTYNDVEDHLENSTSSKHKHLMNFFKIKPDHAYKLFDLISKYSEADVKFIIAVREKTYQWNASHAALSAFFAYLKDKLGLMMFNDDKQRTTVGKSAVTFFTFSGKEPEYDTFKKSKLNTEKYFRLFDRLFDQIKGKAQSYFDIEEWKDLRSKK